MTEFILLCAALVIAGGSIVAGVIGLAAKYGYLELEWASKPWRDPVLPPEKRSPLFLWWHSGDDTPK